MRSEQEVNRAIEQYADAVRRLCMIHLKNYADTEDIFQTVFLKYVLSSVSFESEEHEKAWFIRVTINACKDLLKSFFRSRTVPLEELLPAPDDLMQEFEMKQLLHDLAGRVSRQQMNIVRMKGCGYGIREIASREKLPMKRIKELLEEVRAVFLELCYE